MDKPEIDTSVLVPARVVPATYLHQASHVESHAGSSVGLSVAYQGVVEQVRAQITRTFESIDGGPTRKVGVRLDLLGEVNVQGDEKVLATDVRLLR